MCLGVDVFRSEVAAAGAALLTHNSSHQNSCYCTVLNMVLY